MRQVMPFDPIEVGEIDYFYFDFTQRIAPPTYILATAWTCQLHPFSSGSDPNPQSRIQWARPITQINVGGR
jgi:hypothetical protein